MIIFILNTGRCRSTTFIRACNHITNYPAGHESPSGLLGRSRFAYPDNHILHDVQLIIECGVGISTLYALNPRPETSIRVLGIDDDPEWVDNRNRYLNGMNVDPNRYRPVHAPIREYQASGSDCRKRYDTTVVQGAARNLLGQDGADMLIVVDGPKGAMCNRARHPSLPVLREFLAGDCSIFPDELARPDEGEIAARWCRDFRLRLDYTSARPGIELLRPLDSARRLHIF